jgi:ABC-2 type transport system ATP-binding protein
MLHAQSLTKWYGAIRAVSDVSFTVAAGEVLGYLGPNGSGKTTTVGMVLGLVEPSGGSVLFRGQDIADDPVDFRRNVGYVPEEPHLYPYLSGFEYLELVADLRDMDARVSRKRIEALLEVFGLETFARAALSSYSKGMRQKVLISAALLHNPALLIFDEPVSGLDATSALVFRHLLAALAAAGKAVMYCSHELDAVEKTCSRVIVLHHGTVVADDSVDRLRESLSQASLEGAFQQLVAEVDPAQAAKEIVRAMAV